MSAPSPLRPVRRHPRAPDAVRWIVRTLEEAGYETWAVGGAVRDVLLGVESVDWDFATRARPPEIRRLFRRTVPLGIEHGTVGVLSREGVLYEVTTFRKDVETFGRHAVVEFADRVEDDLARRDFTINAVAWHPLRDELYDPFDGVGDLERGLLRTVGKPAERFAEDYLRVLRALRFAGRFGLTVASPTWRALCRAVDRLPELSPERIREELLKILQQDERPSGALTLWAASGALAQVAPELDALVGCPPAEGPGPLDAWSLGVLAADTLPPSRWVERLGALVAEAGAPASVPGHESAEAPPAEGAEEGGGEEEPGSGGDGDAPVPPGVPASAARGRRRVAALLSRLRFSNAMVDRVAGNVAGGAVPPGAGASGADLRRFLAVLGPHRVPDLVRIWGARARVRAAAGSGAVPPAAVARAARRLREELAGDPPLTVGELALDGRDLIRMGLRPGPRFGDILDDLLDHVLDHPEANRPGPLAARVRERWLEGGDGPSGGEVPP